MDMNKRKFSNKSHLEKQSKSVVKTTKKRSQLHNQGKRLLDNLL